jgi:hypothetical protein
MSVVDTALTAVGDPCGSQGNLAQAMFNLMHARQGTQPFSEFVREVDKLATLCQFDTKPYDKTRAMRDAIIFGTSDENLRQEALTKDFSIIALLKAAIGYENSCRSTGGIRGERNQTSY